MSFIVDDGLIRYDHEKLHTFVQEMFNCNDNIHQQMEDLENQVKANKELFQGVSAEGYGVKAIHLGQMLEESTQRLQGVATHVGEGANQLMEEDRQLAHKFS